MDLKKCDIYTHKANLEKLLELHTKHTNTKSEIAMKISQLEEDNEEIGKRLLAIIKAKIALVHENLNLQQKIENNKLKEPSEDVTKYFDTVCELFGYTLSDIAWDTEHRIQLVNCYYNKDCYVRLEISGAGLMSLLEIVPQHPNFISIREHFLNTQDVTSLLANLRKYFGIVENS